MCSLIFLHTNISYEHIYTKFLLKIVQYMYDEAPYKAIIFFIRLKIKGILNYAIRTILLKSVKI